MKATKTIAVAAMWIVAAGAGDAAAAGDGPSARQARDILEATGVRGGLIVHVGCGDGKLTAALGARDGYVVRGLDRDAAKVAKVRAHIRSRGPYGKVSAGKRPAAIPVALTM
jgi:2-polyprenyl-3-methyl-5-hydroxy-6-metoxy-1,4-benzoquinol methylase